MIEKNEAYLIASKIVLFAISAFNEKLEEKFASIGQNYSIDEKKMILDQLIHVVASEVPATIAFTMHMDKFDVGEKESEEDSEKRAIDTSFDTSPIAIKTDDEADNVSVAMGVSYEEAMGVRDKAWSDNGTKSKCVKYIMAQKIPFNLKLTAIILL